MAFGRLRPRLMETLDAIIATDIRSWRWGQFSRLQSDWDLLVQLARQSAFDIFVDGQSLYFQPSDSLILDPTPVAMRDVRSARIERNLGLPRNTAAKVQSWSSQNMAAYSSDDSGGPTNADQSSSPMGLPFLFSGSNYTSPTSP